MEERKQQQQLQKKTSDLLKAKNYLRAHLRLQENSALAAAASKTDEQQSTNIPSAMAASRLRSNSFLMRGKNVPSQPSSELSNLLVSFEGTSNGSGGDANSKSTSYKPEATQSTSATVAAAATAGSSQASSLKPSQLSGHLQQQAALKSSLVANTQTSLARNFNKKISNENLKATISKIARQKSGDQLKTMSMHEKFNRSGKEFLRSYS